MNYYNELLYPDFLELNHFTYLSYKIFNGELFNINPEYKILWFPHWSNNLKYYRIFELNSEKQYIHDVFFDNDIYPVASAKFINKNGALFTEKYQYFNEKYKNEIEKVMGNKWNKKYPNSSSSIYLYYIYNEPDKFFDLFITNRTIFNEYIELYLELEYAYVYKKDNYICLPKLNKRLKLSDKYYINVENIDCI